MKYGILLACCKKPDGCCVCLVRGFECYTSPLGDPILNELECPLLTLTRTIFAVKTKAVKRAVSIVHECTTTCQFVTKMCPRKIEREQVLFSRLEYEHDYAQNYMYCLNIYAMLWAFFFVVLLLSCARKWIIIGKWIIIVGTMLWEQSCINLVEHCWIVLAPDLIQAS